MSLFQLSLIFHLFLHVYGADEISSTTTTNDHNDNRNRSVTNGINRIVGGSPTTIKQYPFMASFCPLNFFVLIVFIFKINF